MDWVIVYSEESTNVMPLSHLSCLKIHLCFEKMSFALLPSEQPHLNIVTSKVFTNWISLNPFSSKKKR